MPSDDCLRPLDRRPTETAKAYAAFRDYVLLGPQRTVEAAWRAWRAAANGSKQPPGRPSGQYRKWARQHEWEARAIAHDEVVVRTHAQDQHAAALADAARARARLAALTADRLEAAEPADLALRDAVGAVRTLADTMPLSEAVGAGEGAADAMVYSIIEGLKANRASKQANMNEELLGDD